MLTIRLGMKESSSFERLLESINLRESFDSEEYDSNYLNEFRFRSLLSLMCIFVTF